METLAVIQGEADNEAVNDELSVWRPDKDGLSVGEIEAVWHGDALAQLLVVGETDKLAVAAPLVDGVND